MHSRVPNSLAILWYTTVRFPVPTTVPGLVGTPVVGLSPLGTPDNCFTYREPVCLLFLNYALEGIFPEIRPLIIVLISFRVSPFRTFRIDLLYEQDAVLSV